MKASCSIEGCDRDRLARGWCSLHYQRWKKYGDPLADVAVKIHGDHLARFWSKVDKDGPLPMWAPFLGPCWLWADVPDAKGYSSFWNGTKIVRAHNYSYELHLGPVPDGLELDHWCRVRGCVNPSHLDPVTHAENVRRSQENRQTGRYATHCKRGHELTPESVYDHPKGGRQCKRCKRELAEARANR